MTKQNILLIAASLLLIVVFTACPLLGPDLRNYTCLTAQELTDYLNSLDFGSTFTLKDSNYKSTKDYKSIEVFLEADNLPGKTIYAYQSFSYWRSAADSSRTTIPYVSDYRFTDYYYVKYQDEILSHIEELYKPLLKDFEKDKTYKITIEADPDGRATSLTRKVDYFDNAESFIKNDDFYIKVYCQIKKDISADPDFERKYNAFRYDLAQNKTMSASHNFTFTTEDF